jgi:hypothetical protein
VLDAQDLHVLMERNPRIAERIREVARSRIKRELVTPKGDIVTEEIEDKRAGRGTVALSWLPAPSDRGVLRAGFLRCFDIGQGCFGTTSPMCKCM